MKTPETNPQDTLDGVIKDFARRITFVRFDSHTAQTSFKDPHKSFAEALRKYKTADPTKKVFHTGVAAYALDLRVDMSKHAARMIPLDTRSVDDEELLGEMLRNYNAQLRWLLVSAYESYARFMKDIYAALGFLDNNSWPCEHYGDIAPRDIPTRDSIWFSQRARKLRPEVIRKRLRVILPGLCPIEHPTRWPNPLFWVTAIQQFRHAIVHAEGIVAVSELVESLLDPRLDKLLKKRDLSPSSKRRLFKLLRPLQGDHAAIWLVDDARIESSNYALLDSPFSSLIEELSSHACLVYSCSSERFGFTPYWERK